MAEYEDGIFSNLPQRRGRAGDDNSARSFFRELRGMYVPEGPLPPRPHSSGKGGPSLGVSNAPPAGSASPTITGTPAVGQTLSCDNGVWFNAPTSYTYQWNGTAGSPTTNSTYVVVSSDLGHTISCTVTATNAHGSASATSNSVLIVALPANTSPPVISGATTIGATLTLTSPGVWSGSPTYTYLWSGAGSPVNGSTYVTVTADGGTSVTCQVTATNAAGSASQASNAIAVASGAAVQTVWSASDAAVNAMTLSNGGITVTETWVANYQSIRSSTSKTSGKWYIEFSTSITPGQTSVLSGFGSAGFDPTNYLGATNYSVGIFPYYAIADVSSGFTVNYSPSASTSHVNDVVALAIDFTAGSIWIAVNNVWMNGSNPATGSLPIISFVPATVGALFAGLTFSGVNPGANPSVWTLQTETALGRARRLAEKHND